MNAGDLLLWPIVHNFHPNELLQSFHDGFWKKAIRRTQNRCERLADLRHQHQVFFRRCLLNRGAFLCPQRPKGDIHLWSSLRNLGKNAHPKPSHARMQKLNKRPVAPVTPIVFP